MNEWTVDIVKESEVADLTQGSDWYVIKRNNEYVAGMFRYRRDAEYVTEIINGRASEQAVL